MGMLLLLGVQLEATLLCSHQIERSVVKYKMLGSNTASDHKLSVTGFYLRVNILSVSDQILLFL